jgi:uncharacterized metal-binding protein YceD (DUF177 family)
MDDKAGTTRFSRPIDVEALGGEPFEVEIGAGDDERAALARRFELVSLEHLAASVRLTKLAKRGHFRLSGHMSADVVQSCVVTLEPVASHIEEDFERLYSESAPGPAGRAEVELTLASEEPAEAIEGGFIDAGEALAEQLALALDPYPRRLDASLQELGYPSAAGRERASPFGALAQLNKDAKED